MVDEDKQVTVYGRLPRIARLSAEYYEFIENPEAFVSGMRGARSSANLLTFVRRIDDSRPELPYAVEPELIAVLKISTYDHWFRKQVNDKTRNMIRRAGKKGVEIREVGFSDELVRGIKGIYDEVRLRQGKPFAHFGKNLETLKRDHATYLERSQFIGAYLGSDLVGFLKLVHGSGISNVMQIISRIAHRDKAPTNALLAKAVELCSERSVPRLHYGQWSRGGLGEFKQHHGFEPLEVQRYFVPLDWIGSVALRAGLHRNLSDRLPERWVDRLTDMRARWNAYRFRGAETRT